MMRILMFLLATVALSWILAFSRVMLGMVDVEPTWLTIAGLLGSVAVLVFAVFVYGFYMYKQEKAKGTVKRIIAVYETAIQLSTEARAKGTLADGIDEQKSTQANTKE